MAHSSWGPGWPNCQYNKIKTDFIVSGTRFPGGIRFEIVDLTAMLVQETKNRGYRFGTASDPSYGCWGFSCRAISGTNNPSNHSWGLAVDINAPSNPYTSPLKTDMPAWMPDLWNEYGWRWGGDYSGSKDAMHYEFMGSVTDAANQTARARSNGLGGGTPPQPPKDWFEMATEADLRRIVGEELDVRSLNPQGINDLLANVLRAPEFKLDAGPRNEDVFRTVTDVLQSPEFDLGATRRDTRDTKADTTALLSRPA